jgi:hypothetical protein
MNPVRFYIKKVICLFVIMTGGIFTLYGQSPLCASTATNFGFEYVAGITINGQYYAGNTGFSGPGYYDYTATPVPNINAGDVITISYTARTNGNYLQYFKFWFDFNGNGVLTDPGELVLDQNATISNTTQTFNRTFTVPTSVFNGQVYMRFIMVFSSSPTICGNYSYGNTFDFKTTITGATDPFNHSGFVKGALEQGIPSIPVKLFYKLKTAQNYTLFNTYTTNSEGQYTISTNLNANLYDFRLVVDQVPTQLPSTQDIAYFAGSILSQSTQSKYYYNLDTNQDSKNTTSDLYQISRRIQNTTWNNNINYRLFTPQEWNIIKNTSNTNYKNEYPGVLAITQDNILPGQISNLYLIRTGHRN